MDHGGNIYNKTVDIDFSVNLNPYKLSGSLEQSIRDAIDDGIRDAIHYPDPAQAKVRAAISEAEKVPADCICAGSGASELIFAVTDLVDPKTALIIEPGFGGYAHALSSRRDCKVRRYILDENDGFEAGDEVADEITDEVDIIFVQDPINPTGRNINGTILDKILEKANKCGSTVLIDRSFYMLSEASLSPDSKMFENYVNKHNNIFIVNSYTKSFALPGLRMGYVMSTKDNIRSLFTHLPEWNLSSVASSVMTKCAKITADTAYLKESVSFIAKERAYLEDELKRLGFKVFESDTVFILFKDEGGAYKGLYDTLLEGGILIRKCDNFKGLDRNYYRVAVRSRADNEKLTAAIRKIRDEY